MKEVRGLRWRRIVIAGVIALVAIGLLRAWDASRQLHAGDGWRLLAHQRATGDRNQVQVITDQAGLQTAWEAMLLHSDTPTVDFDRWIVTWLTPVGTLACVTRLDEIRFDREHGLVDGAFSLGLTFGCRSPSVGDSFLVAVERDRLPDPPYHIRILGPDPIGGENGRLEVSD